MIVPDIESDSGMENPVPPRRRYILSVDVEDYFQVEAFSRDVPRTEWDNWPSRVVANTRRALDLCDECGAKATYFVLGWVAQKFPSLVREIQSRGHELACHGFWHRPVYSLAPEAFRQDLRQAREAIEQSSGSAVSGYRAPSWSITANSLWALDILAEEGFVYDSSIFPIRHDFYGIPGAKRFPHTVKTACGRSLIEFPPATVEVCGARIAAAGGGYLRLLPMIYTEWAMRRLDRELAPMVVLYFHPWELDPEQPRIPAGLKWRLRHYTNLDKMGGRLRRLLRTHRFEPFAAAGQPGVSP
jgi:polysaccharide deacetylase family protein (PEP-CTERM system associated)